MSQFNVNDVMLDLIEHNSFNAMNGPRVATQLRSARGLWDGVMFVSPNAAGLTLRDAPTGHYNADTIYLLTTRDRAKQLFEIVVKWNADSIGVVDSRGAWSASRWDSEDCDTFNLKPVSYKDEDDKLSSFLWSNQHDDQRTVIRVWWD